MLSIERRLEKLAEAVNGRDKGCICDGGGSLIVVRYVAPEHASQYAGRPYRQRPLCPQHPRYSIRYERFDRHRAEYVEIDPQRRATSQAAGQPGRGKSE